MLHALYLVRAGGTPWPMAFIFVPLETISYTFRAVSLGVRLWVNMLAGHTLLHILTGEPRQRSLGLMSGLVSKEKLFLLVDPGACKLVVHVQPWMQRVRVYFISISL